MAFIKNYRQDRLLKYESNYEEDSEENSLSSKNQSLFFSSQNNLPDFTGQDQSYEKKGLINPDSTQFSANPVKYYFKDMGNFLLLTKKQEVELAKKIERGQKFITKALAKTKLILNEVIYLEEKIKENPTIIYEAFEISQDDFDESLIQKKKASFLLFSL